MTRKIKPVTESPNTPLWRTFQLFPLDWALFYPLISNEDLTVGLKDFHFNTDVDNFLHTGNPIHEAKEKENQTASLSGCFRACLLLLSTGESVVKKKKQLKAIKEAIDLNSPDCQEVKSSNGLIKKLSFWFCDHHCLKESPRLFN